MSVIFTKEALREKCSEWQKILRLQDWDVRTSIVRERDMVTKESNAEITVNLQHRLAHMRIIDPVDFSPDNTYPQDMERNIVHELLHIHKWPFTVNLPDHLQEAEEQAINMITAALIRLHRGGEDHGGLDDVGEAEANSRHQAG